MSSFPESWVLLPLAEVIQTQKGKKPIDLGPQSDKRTVPYINIAAFETKIVGEYAPEQDIPKCEITDTLLVWDGARAGLSGRGISGYIGSTLARVTSDLCEPSYLFYFINSNYETLNSQTKGVGIPHINPVVLNELQFPLAPLPEQKRIVDKLEELLSDLDAGVDELKSAQAKLVQYRQSLLKSAVEGTLSAEWRTKNTTKETGEELLQRILKERRKNWEEKQLEKYKEQSKEPPKGWQDKYPEPVQPDTKDLPMLPQGWVWTSLDQMSIIFKNGMSNKPNSEAIGYPILRINAVRPMRVDLNEVRFLNIPENEASNYFIEEGDLLVTRYNGSTELLGVFGVVRSLNRKTLHPDKLIRIKTVLKNNLADWIEICASLGSSREYILSKFKTTSGQKGVSGEDLKKMPIPLPSYDEMGMLKNKVDVTLIEIYEKKLVIDKSLEQSIAQRKNIITDAFKGKLVNQIKNEETASVLLNRIRAKRKEQQNLPKKKRVIKKIKESQIMARTLREVLAETGDWMSAQEAFRRCGVSDGATTDEIETIYSELRELDQSKILEVKTVYYDDGRKQLDRIRLLAKD